VRMGVRQHDVRHSAHDTSWTRDSGERALEVTDPRVANKRYDRFGLAGWQGMFMESMLMGASRMKSAAVLNKMHDTSTPTVAVRCQSVDGVGGVRQR